jgi:hypothetical protein
MNYILLILALSLVVYFVVFVSSEIIYVRSDVDNNVYLIRRGLLKSEQYLKDSANTLGEINVRILRLIDHIDFKYKTDNDKNYFIEMLKYNYKPTILSEAAVDKRYTTYTIDKQDMHVCLRTRDQQEKLYDVNLLMYVVLHELAHLCNYDRQKNPIQGHGKEFKEIFKFLVREAIDIGIYEYTNYFETPVEYCNIVISSQII